MSTAHDIILAPVITERSTQESALGRYTFKVAKEADKVTIRKACEELFNVRVLKVNTRNVLGKTKRRGYTSGKTAAWKKAVITIDTNPEAQTYFAKGGKEVKQDRKYKTQIEEFGFGQ